VAVERFTTRDGAAWEFEQSGHGPVVLALHGVGGGAWFFRGLPARLGTACRVIATELPAGLADDGSARPASLRGWAADLAELIEARVDEPVVVVGHSLGTILALELWRLVPDRVRALIFVGGLPEVRAEARERLTARVAAIRASGSMKGWGPRISPGVFARRAFTAYPELVGLFEQLIETHPPGTYVRNVQALLDASAVDVVPTVTVPCLSLSGREDAYAPPEAVSAFVAGIGAPCRQVVWPDVGHMPFFEAPELFAGEIATFLAELPR
jgi:pimeloyl-ACP methyl ester carboxylesterase